ncbi:hypothetical protein L345_07170, partial [Ophiophagus hannah]
MGDHGKESKGRREDSHNNILSPELKAELLEFGGELLDLAGISEWSPWTNTGLWHARNQQMCKQAKPHHGMQVAHTTMLPPVHGKISLHRTGPCCPQSYGSSSPTPCPSRRPYTISGGWQSSLFLKASRDDAPITSEGNFCSNPSCPCLLPMAQREELTQSHPTGFIPKAGLELTLKKGRKEGRKGSVGRRKKRRKKGRDRLEEERKGGRYRLEEGTKKGRNKGRKR